MHEKQGDCVVRGHADGRGCLATMQDQGRVGPVVQAETDNNADVADQR